MSNVKSWTLLWNSSKEFVYCGLVIKHGLTIIRFDMDISDIRNRCDYRKVDFIDKSYLRTVYLRMYKHDR